MARSCRLLKAGAGAARWGRIVGSPLKCLALRTTGLAAFKHSSIAV